MMSKLTKQNILSLVTSIVLFAFVPIAFAWTPAPPKPPEGNTLPPLTVSPITQLKSGSLGVLGLGVFGQAMVNPVEGDTYDLSVANRKSLALGVNGKIGADELCDKNGNNCVSVAKLAALSGNTVVNNTTTASGDYVFINPNNYTGGPLACTPGINYQISSLRVTAKNIATYNYEPLLELQPGNWTIDGNITYGRYINSNYGHGFLLRSDVDGVKKTVASQAKGGGGGGEIKGGGAMSFAKKAIAVPASKTGKIEMGVFNAVATGQITTWCKQ